LREGGPNIWGDADTEGGRAKKKGIENHLDKQHELRGGGFKRLSLWVSTGWGVWILIGGY